MAIETAPGRAFTSTLSAGEYHAIRSAGFTPLGQVFGSCVYQIANTGLWNCNSSRVSVSGVGRRRAMGQPATAVQLGPWLRALGLRGGRSIGFSSTAMVNPLPELSQALYEARALAMERARQGCQQLGGDGVVAVRLRTEPFPGGGLEVQVVGTAVRADGPIRPARPFLSDLSGQEFAVLVRAGWVPCALVLGIATMIRHKDWGARWAKGWSNQEVPGYTQLVQKVRAAAREGLRQDCAHHGGSTVVIREMTLHIREQECGDNTYDHVAESVIVGTALVPFEHVGGNAPDAPLTVRRL